LKIAIFVVAVAGDTGAALRACQLEVSAEWRMPDSVEYWFGDEAVPEQAESNFREAGYLAHIGGVGQDSGGLGAVETDIGYS
jgi:hypothetical protein